MLRLKDVLGIQTLGTLRYSLVPGVMRHQFFETQTMLRLVCSQERGILDSDGDECLLFVPPEPKLRGSMRENEAGDCRVEAGTAFHQDFFFPIILLI